MAKKKESKDKRESIPVTRLTIWERRRTVVRGMIHSTLDTINRALRDKYTPDNKQRLQALFPVVLGAMERFLDRHFDFFRDFPESDMPEGFKREMALRVTLEQIQRDLNLIHQVALQRIAGNTLTQQSLKRVDMLAELALQPAHEAEMFGEQRPVALTYFQKSASVRTIPYVNFAFVGIPFTTALATKDKEADSSAVMRDLLAIPHEIGHFVYWWAFGASSNSSVGAKLFMHNAIQKELNDQYSNFHPWARRWIEEAIADLYSTIIAGPAIALSAVEIAESKSQIELLTDDGDHPIAYVRPFLHTKVLSRIASQPHFPNWAAAAAQTWDDSRKPMRVPLNFVPKYTQDAKEGRVGFVEAENELEDLVKLVWPMLSDLLEKSKDNWWQTGGRSSSKDFYADFDPENESGRQGALERLDAAIRDLPLKRPESDPDDFSEIERDYDQLQAEIVQQEQILNPANPDDPETSRRNEWWARLIANGWLEEDGPTEGPKFP